ncbi:MAG: DUF3224 domain-containing protein [Candidatus Sulfotelmatobacter sp.]
MKPPSCTAPARIIATVVAAVLANVTMMSITTATSITIPAVAIVCLGWPTSAHAQTTSAPVQKGTAMPIHATGPFDVKLAPQTDDKVGDPTVGRMSIDKQFHGDLEATSKGQMLTAMTETKGSAGYVAIERVTGTLHTPGGVRSGSFALQHFGTLTRGAPQLNVTVVPDSGTGQLVGLTGKMTINIAGGKHSYDFEYTLPDAP